MRIATDSRPMEQPKPDYESDHLYQLYSLFATDAQKEEMAAMYRAGNFGYGTVKKALADAAESYFAAARERREKLAADPAAVQEILRDGRCPCPEESRRSLSASEEGVWSGLEARWHSHCRQITPPTCNRRVQRLLPERRIRLEANRSNHCRDSAIVQVNR